MAIRSPGQSVMRVEDSMKKKLKRGKKQTGKSGVLLVRHTVCEKGVG